MTAQDPSEPTTLEEIRHQVEVHCGYSWFNCRGASDELSQAERAAQQNGGQSTDRVVRNVLGRVVCAGSRDCNNDPDDMGSTTLSLYNARITTGYGKRTDNSDQSRIEDFGGDRHASTGHTVAMFGRLREIQAQRDAADRNRQRQSTVNNPIYRGPPVNGGYTPPVTQQPTVYISPTSRTVDEDAGTVSFTVRLTRAPATGQQVTVYVSTADSTATSGEDYAPVAALVTFPAGVTSGRADITVHDDDMDEADTETFSVDLLLPTNAALGTARATAVIRDDDDPSVPDAVRNLTLDCSTVGVNGEVTASWDAPAQGQVSAYRKRIWGPNGYTHTVFNTVTDTTQTFTNATPSWGEYRVEVLAFLLGVGEGPAIELTQDCQPPLPVVSLDNTALTVAEGSSVTISASLDTAPDGAASVRFLLSGSTNGDGSCGTDANYYVVGDESSFNFTSTRTTDSITLTACDDTDTDDETVTLVLTHTGINDLQRGMPNAVVVTITDDDTTTSSNGFGWSY